jgi:glycosyltransferase involved in cell wall biosynthesis
MNQTRAPEGRIIPVDVTVIIPTYNRLWSLPDTVDSCRNNACNTELIIVDDGSTDGTWEWLQMQPDVRAIRQDNFGKDWAVNKAFAVARGEYIRFLDSDDKLISGANEIQLDAGRSASADVVVAGYIEADEIAGTNKEIHWTQCDDFIAQQLGECGSSHYSAYLFRREFIQDVPHRQEFGARDDRMFVIETALKLPKVTAVDSLTFVHRHHGRERLQVQRGLAMAVIHYQQWNIYKKAARILDGRGDLTDRRRRAISRALWPLAHWLAYADRIEAAKLFDWIIEIDPTFAPPDSGVLGALYRNMGFRNVELLLSVRRRCVNIFRRS